MRTVYLTVKQQRLRLRLSGYAWFVVAGLLSLVAMLASDAQLLRTQTSAAVGALVALCVGLGQVIRLTRLPRR